MSLAKDRKAILKDLEELEAKVDFHQANNAIQVSQTETLSLQPETRRGKKIRQTFWI